MSTALTRTGPQEIKRVKGYSDKALDWPKLGNWKLGAEFRNTSKEHPENLDCFRPPDTFDAEQWCGDPMPKELQIELPSDNPELCLTDQLEWWGDQEGLKCKGDGETALRKGEDGWTERPCTCEMLHAKSGCGYRLRLWFLMPKVPGIGVWQLGSSSTTTSSRLRGDIQMIRTVFGRLTGIPLVLWREATDFHPLVKIKGKKRRIKTTHHIPRIKTAETMELANDDTGEIEEVAVTIDLLRKMSAQLGAATPALPGSRPPAADGSEDMPRDLIANATPEYPDGEEPEPEPDGWGEAAAATDDDDPGAEPEVYDEPEPEPEEDADTTGATEPGAEPAPGEKPAQTRIF